MGVRSGVLGHPGEATVYVLQGRVRLAAGDTVWDGTPGDPLIVPDARHSPEALEVTVVLRTGSGAHPGSPTAPLDGSVPG